jgi:hypothetical protein
MIHGSHFSKGDVTENNTPHNLPISGRTGKGNRECKHSWSRKEEKDWRIKMDDT